MLEPPDTHAQHVVKIQKKNCNSSRRHIFLPGRCENRGKSKLNACFCPCFPSGLNCYKKFVPCTNNGLIKASQPIPAANNAADKTADRRGKRFLYLAPAAAARSHAGI